MHISLCDWVGGTTQSHVFIWKGHWSLNLQRAGMPKQMNCQKFKNPTGYFPFVQTSYTRRATCQTDDCSSTNWVDTNSQQQQNILPAMTLPWLSFTSVRALSLHHSDIQYYLLDFHYFPLHFLQHKPKPNISSPYNIGTSNTFLSHE